MCVWLSYQVEYHVYQQPRQLVEYCREEGIVFQGYSPLAKGQALGDPTVLKLAEKYGRTPAQICIRWSIQVDMASKTYHIRFFNKAFPLNL